jgi:selenide,water dikinase
MEKVKLTALASCAGCAAKLDPGELARVLRPLNDLFNPVDYPALIIGLNLPDDAAVYRLNEEQAIISTVDFFPPVVDDPYAYGAIAAANALSDVYAMGGTPLFAINLVAYPDGLGIETLTEILRGGGEKVRESGAVIAGGHTITDKEPKYGMAVTGIVKPGEAYTKGGALAGDALVLTKPLGTGAITTALKQQIADPIHVDGAVASMMRLNQAAAETVRRYRVHAMTDITGYGLIGHGHEMAHLSLVDFEISFSALHWLPGALDYAERGIIPGGKGRNQAYYREWVHMQTTLRPHEEDLLYDPQTSGGLLIALPPDDASGYVAEMVAQGEIAFIIGRVIPGTGNLHINA